MTAYIAFMEQFIHAAGLTLLSIFGAFMVVCVALLVTAPAIDKVLEWKRGGKL